MEFLEDRPPYVAFEIRQVEDRDATLKAGHYVARDVHYAIITPSGSKDRVEREVESWFANMKEMVAQGRFKGEWLTAYRDVYKQWSEGQEIPETGFPIRNWSMLSPSQVANLIAMNIRTVEDLAAANDEALDRMGMGARALRDRAVDFFKSTQQNIHAAELEKLRVRADGLEEDNKRLAEIVKSQAAKIAELEKGK